jgi:hypothetical protein
MLISSRGFCKNCTSLKVRVPAIKVKRALFEPGITPVAIEKGGFHQLKP